MEVKLNIEKYVSALNNLIGMDYAYYIGDPDVDAIVEIIMLAKKLDERVKEMAKETGGNRSALTGGNYSALEKQVPKKPMYLGSKFQSNGRHILGCYKCPGCGGHIFHMYDSDIYCPRCGQALDWSDEE